MPRIARGGIDGAVEIELLGRAFARETRSRRSAILRLRVPSSRVVIEVAVLARLPDLDRAPLPRTPPAPMRTPSGL